MKVLPLTPSFIQMTAFLKTYLHLKLHVVGQAAYTNQLTSKEKFKNEWKVFVLKLDMIYVKLLILLVLISKLLFTIIF